MFICVLNAKGARARKRQKLFLCRQKSENRIFHCCVLHVLFGLDKLWIGFFSKQKCCSLVSQLSSAFGISSIGVLYRELCWIEYTLFFQFVCFGQKCSRKFWEQSVEIWIKWLEWKLFILVLVICIPIFRSIEFV